MVKFGLVGEKLGHSLSPQIHRLLFQELGIEGSYSLIEVEQGRLASAFAAWPSLYGGVNVTIPYKIAVMSFLTKISPEAAAIGAVNTIHFLDGEARGYNTDYFGFGFLLSHNEIEIVGKKVTVLGSGGAARAVLQYLSDHEVGQVLIVSRKPEQSSLELAGMNTKKNWDFCDYSVLSKHGGGDVIINCTPLGMFPAIDQAPVSREVVGSYGAAVDLIYNPTETVFLSEARKQGLKNANGLVMLVAQAVAAEEIWLERRIDSSIIPKIAQQLGGERK